MASPDSPEYRRYLNRIGTARKIAVVVFAVCGIGYALCCGYVSANTYASGVYFGPSACLWLIPIFGFGTIACLLGVAGFVGESLLRYWHRSALSVWELAAAVPVGLLACIAPFAVLNFGFVIYDNIAFDSLAGWLAAGIALCLLSLIGIGVHALHRHRQGRSLIIPIRSTAVLLGLAAGVMLVIFLLLRVTEARQQHEAVTTLRSLGCRVHYDFAIEKDGHRVMAKDPDYDDDILAPLTGSDFRHNVVRADLDDPDPDLADVLPRLRSLTRLKYVLLSVTVPAEKVRQIERALPGCQIYVTRRGSEERPWPPPSKP